MKKSIKYSTRTDKHSVCSGFPIEDEYPTAGAASSFWARIYMSGPIEVAKQVCREFCMVGLCVTIEPTLFIYTGGEESGYVVGLVNYPRFPATPENIEQRSADLARTLLAKTFQHSALIVTPATTTWITTRE